MTYAVLRRGTLAALAVMSVACGSSAPATPTSPPPVVPAPAAFAPPSFPLSGPSRTFTFDHSLTSAVSGYTTQSRFILFDSGAFTLQYPSGDYSGRYTESNGVITFQWDGWSAAGPWGAMGMLKGGFLTVQYNLIMQLTDFEDATYRLTE